MLVTFPLEHTALKKSCECLFFGNVLCMKEPDQSKKLNLCVKKTDVAHWASMVRFLILLLNDAVTSTKRFKIKTAKILIEMQKTF